MKAKTIFYLLISVLFAYHASASSRSAAIFTKPADGDITLGLFFPTLPPDNARVKTPGFFGKLKAKLIKLMVGKELTEQRAENGKAKKKKTGVIIALVLVGGLAVLLIALGSMNFH